MKFGELTKNIYLNKPADEDQVLISDLNENADNLDEHIAKINAVLNSKAPVQDPHLYGIVKAPNPHSNNPADLGIVATVDYVKNETLVKTIVIVKSRNDLPVQGEVDKIYIIEDEEGYPELIWNDSEYIKNA